MTTQTQQVAQTILEQLGGRRFASMTGAKNFTSGNQGLGSLTFQVPSNLTKNRISHVRVTLTPADVYSVEFLRCRAGKVTEVAKADEVYCDMLVDIFEGTTGLLTHF